jgi:hypothetical protein
LAEPRRWRSKDSVVCAVLAALLNGLTVLNMQAFRRLPASGHIIAAMLFDRATSARGWT